jgi:hypothetical protein
MDGSFFVHPDENGFRIGPVVPTGIPVAEIRSVEYSGPRMTEAEAVADLTKWFEDRLGEGFTFELLDSRDAN